MTDADPTAKTGGWCAPSACAAGICGHEGCPSAYRSWENVDFSIPALELPKLQVRRGGIRYPRFRVELLVHPAPKRFLRRRMWQLHIRYTEVDGRIMHHYMEFSSEPLARNAQQIMKFTFQTINEEYWNERDTSR